MAKGISAIQARLEKAAGRGNRSASPPIPQAASFTPSAAPGPPKAPTRNGKIHIGAYLHPDFKKSLMLVRARTGQDVQTLLAQALNDLFRTHNVPVIDQT